MEKEELEKLVQKAKEEVKTNIGSLSEKTLHKVVKNYLEPDETFHEIKVGQYYADIYKDNKIIEIQTKQFNKLRLKLDCFLKEYKVEVVYPTFKRKYLTYLNKETKEVMERRLSPKIGNIYNIFPELYKIKPYLLDKNFRLRIILFDLEEQRIIDKIYRGKKKTICHDRIPIEIKEEFLISKTEDYHKFLPLELLEEFTSKDFQKQSKLNLRNAQITLNVLTYLGVVIRIGKFGRSILYKKNDTSNK